MADGVGTRHWYIDAMDGLAGLGFASHRPSLTCASPDTDMPALFFQAPDFRPVRVASRAIALAATRSTLQMGLFSSSTEVPFGSPEDVAEFFRRCFVGGGRGGPAGEPRAGEPPAGDGPPPDDGEDDDQDLTRGDGKHFFRGVSMSDEYALAVASFQEQMHACTDGAGVSFAWGPSRPGESPETTGAYSSPLKYRDGRRCLIRGAFAIAWEFLNRLPSTSHEFEQWRLVGLRLGRYLGAVGLSHSRLRRLERHPRLNQPWDFFSTSADSQRRLRLALGPLDWEYPWPFGPWHSSDMDPMDLLDLLDLLPAPTRPLTAFSDLKGRDASLLALLSACLSSPSTLESSTELFDIVLFSAMIIAAPAAGSFLLSVGYLGWESVAIHEVERAAETAKTWLEEQLPRRVFGTSVERLIEQTGSPGRSYSRK